jgi:hypothetical protein
VIERRLTGGAGESLRHPFWHGEGGHSLRSEEKNRTSARSPKGREARDAALGLFVKAKLDETRATEAAKMSRLRALRLAKEAADQRDSAAKSRDRK